MKTALKLLLIVLVAIIASAIMTSCKTLNSSMREYRDSIYIEKLVSVEVPPDSATIRALLQCDENGRVVLSWLDQETSKNSTLKFQLDSLGNLLAKFKSEPGEVQVKEVKIKVIEEKEVEIEKIVEVEKKLSWWQSIKMETGGIALGALIIVLVYFVIRIVRNVKTLGWKAALKLMFKI